MATTSNSIDFRLISKVSSLYYYQDLNQQEIANRLHLSRPKVSRLLKKAREEGIVQISVLSPESSFLELETQLENKFGLKEVLIVESNLSGQQGDTSILKRQIGLATANYLQRTISEGDVLGVSWGTTLQALIDTMQPKPTENIHVVQLLGGVGPPEDRAHAAEISRRLSQLIDSRLTLLQAPGIVGSVEAKNILLSNRQVKSALELFPDVTIAFVGIGAIDTNPIFDKESSDITTSLYQEINDSKAVGDIALNFFDVEGQEVDTSLKDLLIGISFEELKNIETVVGVAGGLEKVNAIRGALKGKYIDVLITDNLVAEKLMG